ncbi:hypothetical protein SUGI_1200630 [Cryptomeria japonica]|uniref:BON1-associated protein 2-like n=1 Tax=Cryptomeria japonica TaxID=3369 RepID=UPI002414B660|nr:BON1-associated protein 2-like [Cryptomeria japonica]GLJ55921.1 hypothetical protein SUGI_1200630 [Cryptomeria japonica]
MDKVAFEIEIISAQDLECVTSFGRPMRTYALVWTDSTAQKCTRIDREGGSYPTWNDKFQMTVNKELLKQKGSAVLVQIYCKTMTGKKRVGSARMPFSDILEGFTKPDSIHFLSYRIRTPNGRLRGYLDLSVRFLEQIDPRLYNSTPQFQMKFPAFPSKPIIPASSSRQGNWRPQNGNTIGVRLSNSYSSLNTANLGPASSSYGYPYSARVSPFNF